MAINKANKLVTSLTAGIAALGSVFGGVTGATAGDALQQVNLTTPNQINTFEDASKWAASHPTQVVILITLGTDSAIMPEAYDTTEANLENGIKKAHGVDSEIFFRTADNPATTVIFMVGSVDGSGIRTASEPVPMEDSKKELEIAVYAAKDNANRLVSELNLSN